MLGLGTISYINGISEIRVLDEITQEETNVLFSALRPASDFAHIKNLWELVVRNGNELILFLESLKYGNMQEKKSDVFLTGNRLLSNYCSSIGMFIDHTKKVLTKASKKKLLSFERERSILKKENFEFRFFLRLRNYVMHYSLPFTIHTESVNLRGLYMSKKNCSILVNGNW